MKLREISQHLSVSNLGQSFFGTPAQYARVQQAQAMSMSKAENRTCLASQCVRVQICDLITSLLGAALARKRAIAAGTGFVAAIGSGDAPKSIRHDDGGKRETTVDVIWCCELDNADS